MSAGIRIKIKTPEDRGGVGTIPKGSKPDPGMEGRNKNTNKKKRRRLTC